MALFSSTEKCAAVDEKAREGSQEVATVQPLSYLKSEEPPSFPEIVYEPSAKDSSCWRPPEVNSTTY
jgi:hypothetical protein